MNYRKLAINVALAALAAGVGAFAAVLQASKVPTDKAALVALITAAAWAAIRAAAGVIAGNTSAVPTIPVDK